MIVGGISMHQLGISIYPEHSTWEQNVRYMEKAASLGFTRIFTCFLSVKESKEQLMETFYRFVQKAHELGFEVAVDTAPQVFEQLGATPEDLSIFHDIGFDIVRLDWPFGDRQDILMTRNPYGIQIEFNGSSDIQLQSLIAHGADPKNMTVCHNFYPQTYSGLSYSVFSRFNQNWNALGLSTAAFVSSQADHTFGPWLVYDGLPTLEMHRRLPIDVQARHLIAMESIDDILIGNAFASDTELEQLSQIDFSKTTVSINVVNDIQDIEKQILFNFSHTGRNDASEYYIRSSWPRNAYGHHRIRPRKMEYGSFRRGDVVIVNDNLERYRGELEVILQPIPNDGHHNLVGRIPSNELIILDEMEKRPDHVFGFIPAKRTD